MRRRIALLAALVLAALAGCSSILPDNRLYLTPTHTVSVEAATYLGLALGAAYLVLDPLAPNWEITEAPLPDQRMHLALKMKRYYSGGAGEARIVFHRRARDLVQHGGFDGYEVVEYSEGLDSSMLGAQRTCEGIIRLSGRGAYPDYGRAPPARMTPESATKPLS